MISLSLYEELHKIFSVVTTERYAEHTTYKSDEDRGDDCRSASDGGDGDVSDPPTSNASNNRQVLGIRAREISALPPTTPESYRGLDRRRTAEPGGWPEAGRTTQDPSTDFN